jgi:hypothetical protein
MTNSAARTEPSRFRVSCRTSQPPNELAEYLPGSKRAIKAPVPIDCRVGDTAKSRFRTLCKKNALPESPYQVR